MKVRDMFAFGADAMRGYPVRTGLMLLAMAIGVASVVVLTSLGEGARRYVSDQFSSLGSNLLIVLPGQARAQSENDPEREFAPRVVIPRSFPAIVDAPVVPAAEVGDKVTGNELVLGVVVNGEPRAYPINMLTGPQREIINDELGGRAIAATW